VRRLEFPEKLLREVGIGNRRPLPSTRVRWVLVEFDGHGDDLTSPGAPGDNVDLPLGHVEEVLSEQTDGSYAEKAGSSPIRRLPGDTRVPSVQLPSRGFRFQPSPGE
jgi:hypothetical protein